MKIAVAGPYSSPDARQRNRNLNAMNSAAIELLKAGHIPLIGINAALPVIELAEDKFGYKEMMAISLAVVEHCDAIVLLAESPGANRERDLFVQNGKPVFYRVEDVIRFYSEKA